jgi:hypothetical protein
MSAMRIALALFLLATIPARADEVLCREVRESGLASCYRQNDQRRGECARHCARCGEEVLGCYTYCEHFCDAPFSEGCGFDLAACNSRCAHRCHEPACADNPGCRGWWCSKDAVKSCTDGCQSTWGSLQSCRAAWCGDGKAKKACLDGCAAGQAAATSCRKSWCGDGKDARACFDAADKLEEDCRKQVETEYKACLSPPKK